MKFKSLLLIILMVTMSMASEYIIKFAYVVSPNTPKGKAASYFAKRVEELSHGKIKVYLYPNAQLGNDKVILRKMKFNDVQMAAPSFAKFTELVPQFGLFDLPFLFKDENHLHKVLDGKVGEKLKELIAKKGYKALAYWDNGFKELTDSKRPLIKPEDCKGLKFRVMGSQVLIAQFKVLGSIPVVLPFNEVYSALQQGVVDGEENTISNIYTKKFYEVQKYMTITNHGYLGYVVVISKKFWDKLPSYLKKIILKAMKETTSKERIWAKELNNEQFQKIKEYAKKTGKFEIDYLTPKQKALWVKKLKTIYPQFYPIIGKDLIEEVIKEGE